MSRTNIKLNQRMEQIVRIIMAREPVLTGGSPTSAVEHALVEWYRNRKEDTMFVTKEFEKAQAEQDRTGAPIWRSSDGYYAVANEIEFADFSPEDADQWTELEPEPRDMVGADYDDCVTAATRGYWVPPINTDNTNFNLWWRVRDTSEMGYVHYVKKGHL